MKSLIVFSHLRWDFVYQRPQHLLTRLADDFKIFFIEEPKSAMGAEPYIHYHTHGDIVVAVPHTNEEGWGFNDKQNAVIGPLVTNFLRQFAWLTEGYGVWFYTPQALPLLKHFDPKLVIFDVMDELKNFVGAPPELLEREEELLRIADVVIAGGPSLWRAKSAIRPDTINLPSAVDASHYTPANAFRLEAEKHTDERLEHNIPHPRLGFFGVIDERMDIELIEKMADTHMDWHIVMVGPVVKIDPASLPQRQNIHWLGSQDYQDLPMLVQSWDVCLMPFALNDSTKFISPTKTLEYMAAEKPIVSTNIADVVELYGEVVYIGKSHDAFIDHCVSALNEDDVTVRTEKAASIIARQSWDIAADTVYDAIQSKLAKKKA